MKALAYHLNEALGPFIEEGSILGGEGGMGAMLFGYLRVPQAQYTHIKVPDGPPHERFAYLSDVLPTAWQAVECGASGACTPVAPRSSTCASTTTTCPR